MKWLLAIGTLSLIDDLILLIAIVFLLGGCAPSPDVMIFVEKDVIIDTTGDVTVTYTANAEVRSDAQLEGTVSPDIDVTIPAIP